MQFSETRISYLSVYSGHKFALKNEGTAHVRDVSLFGETYMAPSMDPCSSLALLNYAELHLVDSRCVVWPAVMSRLECVDIYIIRF